MKKIFLLASCGLLFVQADAQTVKKGAPSTRSIQKNAAALPTDAPRDDAKWPQLEAFHKVMSQTYHPAEKGDFQPIRKRATELSEAMSNLIGTPFPEAYRSSDVKVLVAHLEERVAVVNKMVESKVTDKELMISLNEAHEVFHKLESVCKEMQGRKG